MKTSGVKALVREVLDTLQAPYTEHVIDDVFHAIETNPKFLSRYRTLCDDLDNTVVNNWCGQWIAHALGKDLKTNPTTNIVALLLTCLAHCSVAADLHSMTAADAVKRATSIPVTTSGAASNVEARMKSIGLKIIAGTAYSYETKSELEQPSDKVGDQHFTIQGTQPTAEFKRTTCDMWGDANFMKRGGKFYPENRTANWLMTGQCSTRFAKPR